MKSRWSLVLVAALGLAAYGTSAQAARVVRTIAAQDTVSTVDRVAAAAVSTDDSVIVNSVPLPPRGPVRPPVRPPSRR
jgi:hypothetical protein